jgi:hypothetical protein
MAMKVVLFYTQAQSGWTETWYTASGDPKVFINTLLTSDMLRAAVSFRSSLTYLTAARCTGIGGSKLSYTRSYGTNFRGNSILGTDINPDVVSSDAVVAVDALQVGRKRMFIRGLNDADIKRQGDGQDVPAGNLVAGMVNYLNAFANAGMAIRILQQPPNGGLVWLPVEKVQAVAGVPQHVDVVTTDAAAAPLAVGGQVRFSRVPGDALPGFPSRATILALNPGAVNGVRISYTLRGGTSVFPPSMQLTALAFDYPTISRVATGLLSLGGSPLAIERFSEHKTGRPFGLLRGRARSKVRAH